MAWVPATKLTESQSVKQEIKDFIDSLTPADVGVEEFPGYRIHFEGFTDDCKLSSDYQKNPNKVYKQVYQDFIDREGGRKPVKSSMVGDEEYPILYSVFKAPQSKSVDTAEKAYSIAYKKKQPWPRGSREEKLIRSDWQLSGLYDQYVLKQGVAEDQPDASNVKHVVTFTTSISSAATKSTVVKHYGRTKTFATREAAVAWANKKNQSYRQENKPGRFEAVTITEHKNESK
jgi:hypothetical protein